MFMHIILIKYGPVAAGIIGALYTGGVQTDGALRYRFFKVAGHYRKGEAGQLRTPRKRLQSQVPVFENTLAPKAEMKLEC